VQAGRWHNWMGSRYVSVCEHDLSFLTCGSSVSTTVTSRRFNVRRLLRLSAALAGSVFLSIKCSWTTIAQCIHFLPMLTLILDLNCTQRGSTSIATGSNNTHGSTGKSPIFTSGEDGPNMTRWRDYSNSTKSSAAIASPAAAPSMSSPLFPPKYRSRRPVVSSIRTELNTPRDSVKGNTTGCQ
jgi:hypothetical protein